MIFGDAQAFGHLGMVLVVIHDAALRRVVARLARAGRFSVLAVENFTHARILTLGATPLIGTIVTDLPEHDRDIRDLFAALRMWHPRTPTIVLTNGEVVDHRIAAGGLPPIHWIEKPFAPEEFLDTLARVCRESEPAEP